MAYLSWASRRLKLPAHRLIFQQLAEANNKETIKAPYYLLFMMRIHHLWIPSTMGQWCGVSVAWCHYVQRVPSIKCWTRLLARQFGPCWLCKIVGFYVSGKYMITYTWAKTSMKNTVNASLTFLNYYRLDPVRYFNNLTDAWFGIFLKNNVSHGCWRAHKCNLRNMVWAHHRHDKHW